MTKIMKMPGSGSAKLRNKAMFKPSLQWAGCMKMGKELKRTMDWLSRGMKKPPTRATGMLSGLWVNT
jgi:hypothetical protein